MKKIGSRKSRQDDSDDSDDSDDPMDSILCLACKLDQDEDKTLLCDGCDGAYHLYCLDPPLKKLPDGDWYCTFCTKARDARKQQQQTKIVKKKVSTDEHYEDDNDSPAVEKKKEKKRTKINNEHVSRNKVADHLPKQVESQTRIPLDIVPPTNLSRMNSAKVPDDKLSIAIAPQTIMPPPLMPPPTVGISSRVNSISVRSISSEKINNAAVNAEWTQTMHSSIQNNKLLSHARLHLIEDGEIININIADQGILCKWGSYLHILEKDYTSRTATATMNPFAVYDDDGNELEDPVNSYDVADKEVVTESDLSWWGIRSEPLLLTVLNSRKDKSKEIAGKILSPDKNPNDSSAKEKGNVTHKERSKDKNKAGKSSSVCSFFGTKVGCRKGDSCLFTHNSNAAASVPNRTEDVGAGKQKSNVTTTNNANNTRLADRSRASRSRSRSRSRERKRVDSRNIDKSGDRNDKYGRDSGRNDARHDMYDRDSGHNNDRSDKYKDSSRNDARNDKYGRDSDHGNDSYNRDYDRSYDRNGSYNYDRDGDRNGSYNYDRDGDKYSNGRSDGKHSDKYGRDSGRNEGRNDRYSRDDRKDDRNDKYNRHSDEREDRYSRDYDRDDDRGDRYSRDSRSDKHCRDAGRDGRNDKYNRDYDRSDNRDDRYSDKYRNRANHNSY